MLPSGIVTPNTFECRAVRAPAESSYDVFDSEDWWELLTADVVAYDYGDNNVSLHGVPLCRPGGAGTPSVPSYRRFDESLITIPLDTSVDLTDPVPAAGPRDGEIDSDHPLYGKFVRTGQNISVRVRAYRGVDVSDLELADQLAIWKPKIEEVWNSAPPPTSGGGKFEFECDWVQQNQHYSITVEPASLFRANMFMWSLDMDDRSDPTGGPSIDNLITSAHEFGHFLGLTDGYIRWGEYPWMKEFIKKNLKNKQTVFFLARFTQSMFSNKERAEDRMSRACPLGPVDMMTWQTRISNTGKPIQNRNIPTSLVDTIDATANGIPHKTQPLCWQEILFDDA